MDGTRFQRDMTDVLNRGSNLYFVIMVTGGWNFSSKHSIITRTLYGED